MRYALLNPWRCRGRRCVTAADSRPTMATATGGGGGGAKLRRLRDACACLRGPVSSVSQAALRDVMAVLDTITAEDLCLDREALSGPPKGGGGFLSRLTGGSTNRVTFVPVHEDECYTVGVFALAQGSTIPLHDHPGMVVLSRLLYGDLHVKSFDWIPPANANLHELHALTPAAFLDVIAPPYDASRGRDATYLRAAAPLGKGGVTTLQRIPQPGWFTCKSARYMGPAFDG